MTDQIKKLYEFVNNEFIINGISQPNSTANKSFPNIVIFQNSEIISIAEFFLNCKVIFFNGVTNKLDTEVHDIIQGLYIFSRKIKLNIECILKMIKEQLKFIFKEQRNDFSILIISLRNNYLELSNIDNIFQVKLLSGFSIYNSKTMIKYLIDYLQIEHIKCTIPINKEDRVFFSKITHTLSEEIIEYNNQIGGHGLVFCEEMKFLQYKNIVFKPVQKFPKGRIEICFYEEIFGLNRNNDLHDFQKFVPNYFGLFSYPLYANINLYIGLEDILSSFIHPSIADLKLGQITYEPDAFIGKVAVEKAKYFWREEIGFLFTGIKVFKGKDEDELFLDRFHGLCLDPNTVYFEGILSFLSGHSNYYLLAQHFVDELKLLLQWFENQRMYNFYSSSLLLAYDSMELSTNKCKISVKIIDFTHCVSSKNKDINCIFGLKSLISFFERVKAN